MLIVRHHVVIKQSTGCSSLGEISIRDIIHTILYKQLHKNMFGKVGVLDNLARELLNGTNISSSLCTSCGQEKAVEDLTLINIHFNWIV